MTSPVGVAHNTSPYRTSRATAGERTTPPRFAAFRVHTKCPHCARPVPVNGPSLRLCCASCGNEFWLEAEGFGALFDWFEYEHRSFAGRNKKTSTHGLWASGRGVDHEQLDGLRPAAVPPWLEKRCPTARTVWTASPASEEATAAAVSYGCPHCSTALHVDASSGRRLECTSCHRAIWLPDALWERFHPVPLIATWAVEFRGENEWDRGRRLAREREERQRQRELEAADRERAEKAAAERQRRADVVGLDGRARTWTWIHLVVTLVAIAWPWLAHAGVGVGSTPHLITGALIASTLVLHVVTLAASGKVIHRASDRGDMTFLLWFELAFVWMMPVIGHFLGMGRVFDLLWGENRRKLGPCTRWGGYNWAIISVGGLVLIVSTLVAYLG